MSFESTFRLLDRIVRDFGDTDFRTEIQMSGSAAAALDFERELVAGLAPRFEAERDTLRQLKVAGT